MLSAADIQTMRATLDASLPDTCAIRRIASVPDSAGGQADTPSTIATVACRVSPASASAIGANEQVDAARLEASSPWIITLSHDTDVTEQDQIVSGGTTYEVGTVFAARSWELCRRVLCRRIR
jgi:hypothetical protein